MTTRPGNYLTIDREEADDAATAGSPRPHPRRNTQGLHDDVRTARRVRLRRHMCWGNHQALPIRVMGADRCSRGARRASRCPQITGYAGGLKPQCLADGPYSSAEGVSRTCRGNSLVVHKRFSIYAASRRSNLPRGSSIARRSIDHLREASFGYIRSYRHLQDGQAGRIQPRVPRRFAQRIRQEDGLVAD